MSDDTRPQWASQRAMAWVIDDAPVPVDLAWTLIVIARRCDEHGCGSYQSIPTLAKKTGKSEDQVRRDIVRLRERDLLRLGDQTLPEKNGVEAGKRPVVYDLPMERKGSKPVRESKNKSGKKKETPCMDATPGMDARGGMEAPGTPGMHAGSTPGMDATQRKPLNNPSEQPSSPLPPVDASEPSSTSTQEEGDGVDFDQEKRTSNLVNTIRQLRPHWSKKKITDAITASLDDGRPLDLIERVFPTLAADPDTDYPGRLPKDGPWWNIDQQERTGDRPPWCGQCDEIVRQVQVESQYGGGIVFTRCPRCHPMNQSDATQTSKVNGEFGRHTESWQRRRDRAMSTGERRLTQALDVAAELDAGPVYHPDHPRRLINSHADQDRYDVDL